MGGINFLAVPDPETCLEDCNLCCEDWTGFTVDTYDPDEDGVYTLVNVFSPNGDGTNDYWQVLDYDHPFCAYGAQAFELTIYNIYGDPVWYLNESPDGCCPFQSKAPNNPIDHSSIYWDGTVNTGFLNCYGCEVSASTYYYVLQLWGCDGTITFAGYIGLYRTMLTGQGEPVTEFNQGKPAAAGADELPVGSAPAVHELLLYPNPGREMVVVYCDAGLRSIEVTDMLGRSVLTAAPNGGVGHSITTTDWAPGDYIFHVERQDGMVEHRKFVKR